MLVQQLSLDALYAPTSHWPIGQKTNLILSGEKRGTREGKIKKASPEKEMLSETITSGDSPEKHDMLPANGQFSSFYFNLRELLNS